MATGYFLTKGSKTSCGGQIISGCAPHHTINGLSTAREGDQYICGADKQIYTIIGGYVHYSIEGRAVAGTLHSVGSCACKCSFIPSDYTMSYEDDGESKRYSNINAISHPSPAKDFPSQPPAVKNLQSQFLLSLKRKNPANL